MITSPEQLHVIRCYDRLPPMPGGMEQHVAELTAAQRRLGVRVTEVYNSGKACGEAIRLWPGFRTDQVRPSMLRWLLFYLGAIVRGIGMTDGRIPVLHIHGDWQAFLVGRLVAARFGIPVRAASLHEWVRGSDQTYARALRTYDPVFCTGAREAKRLSRLTRSNVFHMPSAPANLFFLKAQKAAISVDVIAVGTLNERKNYGLLLRCAALLPHLSFAIYGDGPERARLVALAEHLKLENLQFRGAVSREEIHSALLSARLFVSTAIREGSPTSALEAMACGLPVVLTPSNDYSLIVINGENGDVTADFAPEELARIIELNVTNPDRLRRARKISREVANDHRWDAKARFVTDAMIDALGRCQARL